MAQYSRAHSAPAGLGDQTAPAVPNWFAAARALLCLLVLGSAPAASASLTISGTPPTFVQVGQRYDFRPTASGAAAGTTLRFFITNHPSWTTFNRSTGELTGSLIEVAKSACLGIGTLISFISDILERLIIEASVPVIGWLVGAADIAIHIRSFWQKFDRAISLIRRVLDAIEKTVKAIYSIINIMHALKLALTTVAGGLAMYNGSRIDEAAQNNFGV